MSQPSLDKYIEYSGEASKRSRWVLIALLVASVYGMSAVLTARKGAWSWDRLAMLNQVRQCLTAEPKPCSTDDVEHVAEFLARWEYISEAEYKKVTKDHDLPALHIDAAQLEYHIEHQRGVMMDHVAIQTAPFLGFSFDVNDLGVVATITYVTLLMVLALALRREAQNVRIVKEFAEANKCMPAAWALISMRQVFTIVSRETTEHPSRAHRLLIKLDGYLVLLPLFVEIAITYMDFATSGIGVALSSTGMAFLFSVEVLGFFLSLYLVTRCRKEQRALTDLLHRDHWA